jgi:hypothetical protein
MIFTTGPRSALAALVAAAVGAVMQALLRVTFTVTVPLFWIKPIQPVPSVVGADFVTKTFTPAVLSQPPPTTTLPVGQGKVPPAVVAGGRSIDVLPTS